MRRAAIEISSYLGTLDHVRDSDAFVQCEKMDSEFLRGIHEFAAQPHRERLYVYTQYGAFSLREYDPASWMGNQTTSSIRTT